VAALRREHPARRAAGWLAQIGRLMPLTHGIAAAREVAAGASLSSVSGLVWTEIARRRGLGTAAFLLFRWFEFEGRRGPRSRTY
jgi:hypothetical protein